MYFSHNVDEQTLNLQMHLLKPFFLPPPVTNGRHELVPKDLKEEAEKYAKVSGQVFVCVYVHKL